MRVFVTGGNGFIGSRVVRFLCRQGHRVVCLVRPTSRTHRIDDLDLDRVTGDIRAPETFQEAMRSCDACVHLAAISAWDAIDSGEVEDTIVAGTSNVLGQARRVPNLRLVHVSSAAAIGARRGPVVLDETSSFGLEGSGLRYALAKREAERGVFSEIRRGLDAVVVNPAETYGPDDDDLVTAGQVRAILNRWPGLAVRGGTSIAHIDDVAEGIVLALRRGQTGHRYILGGDNLTFAEIVRLVTRLANQRKPVISVPRSLLTATIKLCRSLGLPAPIPPGVADYLCWYWFVDSAKAKTELGYAPRDAEETLRPVVEWLAETRRSRHQIRKTVDAVGSG